MINCENFIVSMFKVALGHGTLKIIREVFWHIFKWSRCSVDWINASLTVIIEFWCLSQWTDLFVTYICYL